MKCPRSLFCTQSIRIFLLICCCLILGVSFTDDRLDAVSARRSEAGTHLSTPNGSNIFSSAESIRGGPSVVIKSDKPSRNHLTNARFTIPGHFFVQTCTPPTGIIISEFRSRGPNGVNDEFVELYNNTDNNLTICTADGSDGWAVASSDGAIRFFIPNNTTIPKRGHYLATGSGYSLGGYATSDVTSGDIPDNTGIALFNTANPANFSTANRFDAVGFTSDSTLYREGAGLTPIGVGNVEYALRRNLAGGTPADSNDNSADFQFLSTDASFGSKLGAPGPENLSSPIQRNAHIPGFLLDTTVGSSVAPNRVRDLTPGPPSTSTLGTLSLRRRFVNNTGGPVTLLRFRITSMTTFPPPSGTADLRAITSTAVVTMNINDAGTCAASGTPATPPCTVTVQGTTLEEPPAQPSGGGYNATLSIALPQPLASAASVTVQFLLGVQQSGNFSFFINVEALSDSVSPRLDPTNQTGGEGEDPLSRNFNWSVPLVNLPGRAGLDLGLSLTYNSLVWTKSNSSISFDDDRGFPSPGFRLGFPVLQPLYFNPQVGKLAYLLITPNGDRIELRQVGSSAYFESADSSYLRLDTSAFPIALHSTDGTKLLFDWTGVDYQCMQIKDRNGNFITINYTEFGKIDTVVDTLSRTIKFNYDPNTDDLTTITQTWTINGAPYTQYWATFTYLNPNLTIDTNFPGLTVNGPPNGSTVKVLSKVTFNDGSRFEFDYTSWGQVWKISSFATNGQLRNYRSYNLPLNAGTSQSDCPRFTERRDWARNWNGDTNGVPATNEETNTGFTVPVATSWTMPDGTPESGTLAQVTLPDGTYDKIYSHSSGWDKGLPFLNETYGSSNPAENAPIIKQKSVVTKWNQDSLTVPLNPYVEETNVYDYNASGQIQNRARSSVIYQSVSLPDGTSCKLPQDVLEYQANATTVLRRTHTEYNLAADYTNRRIIGLVSEKLIYEVDPVTQAETPMSKLGFVYDETAVGTDTPVQHDNSLYGASFTVGRANVTSVKRYDVVNTSQFVTSISKYNTAGSVVEKTDPATHATHKVTISYTDKFAENGTILDPALSFTTLAFPTTVIDADGYSSSIRYNYDFGAPTWKQTPQPNTTVNTPGPEQKFKYDTFGRIELVTSVVNNAYKRFWYGPDYVASMATVNNLADEAYSIQLFDGLGRVTGTASNHVSVSGYKAQMTIYDSMGRVFKQSNPAEINGDWVPAGDDAAGWLYTQQTYDWKGRPLVTTNTDGTTKQVSYTGCGCAGGEVATFTDESNHQQRITSDILGRPWKTEILNPDSTTYSTTVNTYNARDQIRLVRQYQGNESSGTYQETTMTYDGHGRLASLKKPEQTSPANYTYFDDDTVNSITDARGATTTFGYNGRHLTTSIAYSGSSSAPSVTLGYDAAGNRTSMLDGMGGVSYSYDQLSRLTSETRQFADPVTPYLNGSFTLSYGYNFSDQVTSVSDPTDTSRNVSYVYDSTGRVKDIDGNGYGNVTSFANTIQYRAWGDTKHVSYGNGLKADLQYNNRLQPSLYELRVQSTGARHLGVEYRYTTTTSSGDNDGRLKFTDDLDDPKLDRTDTYDVMGRRSSGYAGSYLPDSQVTSGPYQETFSYDVWGNLTGRTWRQYETQSIPGGTIRYPVTRFYSEPSVNNRTTNAGWSYDADGRILTSRSAVDSSYTQTNNYDAAGRMLTTTVPGKNYSFAYDGIGQRVKFAENGDVTYYVTSTVLAGQPIIELNQVGQKKRSYVYSGGQMLAKQESGQVSWDNHDSTGRSVRMINSSGTVTSRVELDPLSVVVDPTNVAEGNSPYSFSPVGFYGTPQEPSMGCTMDRVPAPCNIAQASLRAGGSVQCSGWFCPTVGWNPNREGRGQGGFFKYRYTDEGVVMDPIGGSQKPTPNKPQQPVGLLGREGVSTLIDDIYKMFTDHPGCYEWTNKLLDELGKSTGYSVGSIQAVLEDFRLNGNAGVYQSTSIGGSAGASEGAPRINISSQVVRTRDAATVMGEIIHAAGMVPRFRGGDGYYRSYYNDAAMATAYNKLGVVMTVAQYRNTYPESAKLTAEQYGYDYAESKLAHGAIEITCMGAVTGLSPSLANP